MQNKTYRKSYKNNKKLVWYVGQEPKSNAEMTDVIYYNQKLALECNGDRIAHVAAEILKEEFSENITKSILYDLLLYVLTNKICTMQSIKNVLSYKKTKSIKEIKDVSFNNGEVQLTCLI